MSSYPAEFSDETGAVRLNGSLDFTDPDNQPLGPGASVTVEDIDAESSAAGQVITSNGDGTAAWATPAGGSAPSLQAGLRQADVFQGSQALNQASPLPSNFGAGVSIQSPPLVIAAMGLVCAVQLSAPFDVPDISDNIDTTAFLYVTDLAGTNTLSVNASSSQATPIVGGGTNIDWTGTSATIVGADLTWDDAAASVSSTAGGVYQATLVLACAPD